MAEESARWKRRSISFHEIMMPSGMSNGVVHDSASMRSNTPLSSTAGECLIEGVARRNSVTSTYDAVVIKETGGYVIIHCCHPFISL